VTSTSAPSWVFARGLRGFGDEGVDVVVAGALAARRVGEPRLLADFVALLNLVAVAVKARLAGDDGLAGDVRDVAIAAHGVCPSCARGAQCVSRAASSLPSMLSMYAGA